MGLSDVFEEQSSVEKYVKEKFDACDCPSAHVDDREAGVILRMLLPRKRIDAAAPGEWIIIDRAGDFGPRDGAAQTLGRTKIESRCARVTTHAIRERQDEGWLVLEDSQSLFLTFSLPSYHRLCVSCFVIARR
jgi:hypothetical protein